MQLKRRVGAIQASGGIDARRQPEADAPLVQLARLDPRNRHQRTQPRLTGGRQHAQSASHDAAVLADERNHVGDRRKRHQVEVLIGLVAVVPCRQEYRLGELVGDRGGTEIAAGIAAQQRVHDRGVGQLAVGARQVVIADDHLDTERARKRHLLHSRDAAVDRYEQPVPRWARRRTVSSLSP